MNYTVAWTQRARIDMLALLLSAADKQQLLRAARTVENELWRDPHNAGEGRDTGRRILFERPLCLLFAIDQDEQTVFIERVKWVGF